MHKSSRSRSPSPSPEPPSYNDANGSHSVFSPTSALQVQAIGYDTNQALTGKTLENISVFRVDTDKEEYTSVRRKKSSNSCALVRASDPNTTLISTIYRFGPGRHPRMHVFPRDSAISVDQALDNDKVPGEQIEVKSRSMVSRGQIFDTSLGKFEWRYATSAEERACGADQLLVMERVDSGVQVAHLIRNDEFRTPGTVRYSGGNGGRLMMDLRGWEEKRTGDVEAFVVASCVLMLKREADRFINNNIAAVS